MRPIPSARFWLLLFGMKHGEPDCGSWILDLHMRRPSGRAAGRGEETEKVTGLSSGTARYGPNVVILQLDRDCPCTRTAGRRSSRQAAWPPASPIPAIWFVRAGRGRRRSSLPLVSCRVHRGRVLWSFLPPLGRRAGGKTNLGTHRLGWLPYHAAGCPYSAGMARVCLPRVVNSEQPDKKLRGWAGG